MAVPGSSRWPAWEDIRSDGCCATDLSSFPGLQRTGSGEVQQVRVAVEQARQQRNLLASSCNAAERQAAAAREQHSRLACLVTALRHQKQHLRLEPPPGGSSGSAGNAAALLGHLLGSQDSQGQRSEASTDCVMVGVASQGLRRSKRRMSPRDSGGRQATHRNGSEEEAETARAEAMAAAALYANSGDPAAALVDLLALAVRRSEQSLSASADAARPPSERSLVLA